MDPAKVECMAFLLVSFLYLGTIMSGVALIILSVGHKNPEMEPSGFRDLNLTHSYMSEEEWLSWFQEQRKKIVLLTAGPPFIFIGFIFLRPCMLLHQRSENRRAGINVPPINFKFSAVVKKYALIFSTLVLLSVGLALTVVGNVVSEFWLLRGCEICEEKNFQFQRQLKICRIVGPLVISFGVLLPIVCILYRHVKKKIGDDEDISDVIGQMLSKCLSCVPRTTTDHTESVQNPPEPHSIELGDVPANPVTGSYPRNSAQQPEGQCVHPISTAQPSLTQYQNASPQIRQCYQPYREELPPPSYESVVNQNLALPSAPPSETSGISQGF